MSFTSSILGWLWLRVIITTPLPPSLSTSHRLSIPHTPSVHLHIDFMINVIQIARFSQVQVSGCMRVGQLNPEPPQEKALDLLRYWSLSKAAVMTSPQLCKHKIKNVDRQLNSSIKVIQRLRDSTAYKRQVIYLTFSKSTFAIFSWFIVNIKIS